MRKTALPGILRTRHSAPALLRYLSGLAVWVITFALRLLMQPLTPTSPFLLFIPGLMLVTWLWGRGPTVLYFATTAVVGSVYFVPRDGLFHLTDPIEVTTSLQFVIVAIPVIFIVERLVEVRRELDGQLQSIRQLSAQQQTLLEEINHRVKNHLQAIIALTPAGQDERIDQIRLRMLVLARVYDKLSLKPEGAMVSADSFLTGLTTDFEDSLAPNNGVKLYSSVSCGPLGSKEAVFLGLLANEAVSNSLKYAFPDGRGTIAISLQELGGQRSLVVCDDGVGDGGTIKGTGQGRRLMDRLARDLRGIVSVGGPPGYCVSVTYPSPVARGSFGRSSPRDDGSKATPPKPVDRVCPPLRDGHV